MKINNHLAKKLYTQRYKKNMHTYTYNSHSKKCVITQPNHVLFYGRILVYKTMF